MEGAVIVLIVFGSITVWRWFQMQENIAVSRRSDAQADARLQRLEQTVAEMRELLHDTIVAEHDSSAFRRLGEAEATSVDAG